MVAGVNYFVRQNARSGFQTLVKIDVLEGLRVPLEEAEEGVLEHLGGLAVGPVAGVGDDEELGALGEERLGLLVGADVAAEVLGSRDE